MMAEEGADPILQLQHLYNSVSAFVGGGTEVQGAKETSRGTLINNAAKAYCTIVGEMVGLMSIPSRYSAAVYNALRVASLLLFTIYEDSGSMRGGGGGGGDGNGSGVETAVTVVELDWSTSECVLDGVSKVMDFMPQRRSLDSQVREEFVFLVHLLICAAVRQQKHLNIERNSHPKSGKDANTSLPQQSHALMAYHLRCARALVERGLWSRRNSVHLLSATREPLGGQLRTFFLKTLQEEFTVMRDISSGAFAIVNNAVDGISVAVKDGENSEACFYYYVLPKPSRRDRGGELAVTGSWHGTSSASGFSTGSTAPSSCRQLEGYTWKFPCDGQDVSTPQRVASRSGAAVQWALTVLASMGASVTEDGNDAVVTQQQYYNRTSDFSGFIGELVNVCLTLVHPFLVRQLEFMQHVSQIAFLSSGNSQEVHKQCSWLAEDTVKYRHYTHVVEQFLRCWDDPSSAQLSLASVVSPCPSVPQLSRSVASKERTTLFPAAASTVEKKGETLAEKKEEEVMQWEPVAPALTAHLASATSSDGVVAWSKVVSLFSEVKRSREAEMFLLWNQWTKLRKENSTLAADVVRMQERCDALRKLKSLLFPLKGSSKEELQREWVKGVDQYMRDLKEKISAVRGR